jgi:hypothetical protein
MKFRVMINVFAMLFSIPIATTQAQETYNLKEWNNQIRREKFDLVLPQVMRNNNIDMWIHVMRVAIPDPFGAEDLGQYVRCFHLYGPWQ